MTQSLKRPPLARRTLLRAAGISIALPSLESWRQAKASEAKTSPDDAHARRMVCVGNMLGFYPGAFWPQAPAADQFGTDQSRTMELSSTLKTLDAHRGDFTVIHGLDHGLTGGHFSIHAFLSGVRSVDAKSMPLANMTLDQYAAEKVSGFNRFDSLTIGSETGIHGGCQMSWTRTGTRVPPITGPAQLFEKLFIGVAEKDKARAADRFRLKNSILDSVGEDAKSIAKELNPQDRQKLEEYFSSIREVEKRLVNTRRWVDVPKPEAPLGKPKNTNMVDDLPILYDLMVLALQTDSTRIATLEIGGDFEARDFGFKAGYHSLSHHGKRQESIDALKTIEAYQVEHFARFLEKLRASQIGETNLLEQTSVLFGSGMGDANTHTNVNLPVILAGGGFKHLGQLGFDRNAKDTPPMNNLFVSMLQRFGLPVDEFQTGTGTLRGLEMVG
ncbi:hypothetical protein SV7mr_10490 [Stieleria bergensis]|uniref:DUF1552 domain-containing protein n=1 Tax=Stieleria bergensis TaxID=2528025 RepID=A0A517SR06_9BACT|nr:hypothetical protein SV7mr_10490 [Planctomycetes bacterium SV_7m_r]